MKTKWITMLFILPVFSGCINSSNEVIAYITIDPIFSEPVIRNFEKKTGIKVRAVFDAEETKSTGILNRIIAEAENPQCDVFWSGDPVRAEVLKRKNILEAYDSPAIEDIHPKFFDPDKKWIGFSARARVFIYNKKLMHLDSVPKSIFDLVKKKYDGKIAIANPLYGTTSFHMAALFSLLGDEGGKKFMQEIKKNHIVVAASNGDVKRRVCAGKIPCGLVDSDDAFSAIQNNEPIGVVYPDQDSLGTLIMPGTVSLIKNSGNSSNGKKLIDFLLSRETEAALAISCAQMPLHNHVETPSYVIPINTIRAMNVNYAEAASKLEETQLYLKNWIE